jgi:hypothetical protein
MISALRFPCKIWAFVESVFASFAALSGAVTLPGFSEGSAGSMVVSAVPQSLQNFAESGFDALQILQIFISISL